MTRVRSNVTFRLHRKVSQGYRGEETTAIIEPRARGRMRLRKDSIVSAEGILRGTDGTLLVEASVDIREGDLVEILQGKWTSPNDRYYVEIIEDNMNVTGRTVSKRATVSLDRGRGVQV